MRYATYHMDKIEQDFKTSLCNGHKKVKATVLSSVTIANSTILVISWLQMSTLNIERIGYFDIVQGISTNEVNLSSNGKEEIVKTTFTNSDRLMILNRFPIGR